MALIKPGVWHSNVWVSRTWQEDLWLEYSSGAPPPSPTPAGNVWLTKRRKKPFTETELNAIAYLIMQLGRERNG